VETQVRQEPRAQHDGVAEITLAQARQAADDIHTQMCSSVAVARISRAERHRRLRDAQSIIEKIDANPTSAHLAPREWRMIREWFSPGDQHNPFLEGDFEDGSDD
jgi:hypothetical protein